MLLNSLPDVAVASPSREDLEQYIVVADPLIRSCCSLEPPELYYDKLKSDPVIVEVTRALDIPTVLGQTALLRMLWFLTRVGFLESSHSSLTVFSTASSTLWPISTPFNPSTAYFFLYCST